MKYFFVSDIHGHYTELKKALDASNFDREKDTIVSVGDPFDRGNENIQVLEFLLSCPNRILILGNHDYRLLEFLIFKDKPNKCDIYNGIADTLLEFAEVEKETEEDYRTAEDILSYSSTQNALLLRQYFSELCCGLDFNDFLCIHAWLPSSKNYTLATMNEWYMAISANIEKRLQTPSCYPDKDLVIGHWGTYRLRQFTDRNSFDRKNCNDTFSYTVTRFFTKQPIFTLTALDGTVSWNPKTEEERKILPAGKINVLVKELDETPKKLYPFGADGYFRRLAYTY